MKGIAMINDEDEICGICGEPKSAHVPTAKGLLTHPREARGEGEYVEVYPARIQGGGISSDDWHIPARYEFRAFDLVDQYRVAAGDLKAP
jgi:hypothetical protein